MSTIQEQLKDALIVSCQAAPGDPLEDTETIRRIARAAVGAGAAGLRINGPEHLSAIRGDSDVPIIGIQKRYSDGQLYITPDFASASALASAGASIIALECTKRASSNREPWRELIPRIQRELKLPVMADIATLEEAHAAANAGADFIGTTLNGYTEETRRNHSFNWSLLASMVDQLHVPIVAEGHVSLPEEAGRAISVGAWCVVVGSAITRPGVLTANFVRAMKRPEAQSIAIGVDIGGTSIKAAIVEGNGAVRFPVQVPTDAARGRNAIAAALVQAIEQVMTAARGDGLKPEGVGIASAGAIDAQVGSVFAATENLPGWTGFNLRQFAEERFHLPTFVVNDAHAAVLAELHFGLGKTLSNFVAITIGTGIGGGIVCNGKLLRGEHGFAGTIGHQVIRAEGRACNCGRKGCLEAYVSTAALLREYQEHSETAGEIQETDNPSLALTISQQAMAGDPAALRAYSALSGYLSEGIANIFNLLDPQVVLLSGGLIEGHSHFAVEVEQRTRELLHFGSLRQPRVQLAQAGHYAGVQGAGTLVFEAQHSFSDIKTLSSPREKIISG